LYFQEYARSIFEIEENKVEKEGEKDGEKGEKNGEKEGEKDGEKGEKAGKENEYQQILEGTSSDEKSVSLSMELELNSRYKSGDKSTINVPKENKSIINMKNDEVQERSERIANKEIIECKNCRKSMEDMKGKGSCEDGIHEKYEKDGIKCTEKKGQQKGKQDEEGNIVEHSQDPITPHQWQHFEPFFKWLDNPDKLPEVKEGYRVD
jgi:hypothetical protein